MSLARTGDILRSPLSPLSGHHEGALKNLRNTLFLLACCLVTNVGLKTGNDKIIEIIGCLGGKMNTLYIIVVLLVAIYLIAARRKNSNGSPGTLGFNGGNLQKTPRSNSPVPRKPYRATSIVHDDHACGAVKAIGNKRFLDTDRGIPALPLPDCNLSTCNCKYALHEDRREYDDDRRHPSALKSQLYDSAGDPNRRQEKRGRRKSDWA
jgi:hypothetical protein